ncbi:MAG: Zn-ribbon containing protein, partial [Archaeoglobaceae archaeon]
FEREEIIIALEEDGSYIIHLPSLLKRKTKE